MKKVFTLVLIAFSIMSRGQVGVGTTSPNSTLDVRGSFSVPITTFSGNTTAGTSDNMLVFTGSSATTLTLPTATSIEGRIYWVKNGGTATVTIATTSSQTIDGLGAWSLTQGKTLRVVSNGSNWYVASETYPGSTATTGWLYDGNSVGSERTLGTTSNYALPFITNNTERMRISNTGNVGIGTSTFNGSYPERLIVDAGSSGNTNFQNVIVGKGNTNSYAQLNIQNNSAGTAASSDVVATSNNGNETVNYVDMGINGGGNTSSGVLGGANTAYLYSAGNDFAIGNNTASKNLNFFTNDGTNTERMRINSAGSVGIGTSSFDGANPERLLVDAGTASTDFLNAIVAKGSTNSYVQFNIQNTKNGGQSSTDIVATADNGTETANYVDLGINSSTYNNGASSLLNYANNAYLYSKGEDFVIGNASASRAMIFFTGGDAPANEKFRLNSSGFVMTAGVASSILPSTDNTYNLGSGAKRWGAVYAANGTIQTSDMRLKTNIHTLNYGLREVMNMRPVSYNWKDKPNSNHKIGLIAQEVRSLVPEVVIGDETIENLGMNYAELVPVLVKAIQEQQKQIETLAKEIEKLKRKH